MEETRFRYPHSYKASTIHLDIFNFTCIKIESGFNFETRAIGCRVILVKSVLAPRVENEVAKLVGIELSCNFVNVSVRGGYDTANLIFANVVDDC